MRKLILPKPTGLVVPERRIFIPRVPSRYRQRGFMRLMPSVGMWGRNPLISVDAADFDGTNDYMLRGGGLTGAADSKFFIFSGWFRLDGGNAASQIIFASTPSGGATLTFAVFRNASNAIQVIGDNGAGSTILNVSSTTTYTAGAAWHHILYAVDMANISGSFLYIDDVDVGSAATFTNDTLDFTSSNWMVGAQADAAAKLNGCLAEPYFASGQYLNISVEENRRKYRSAQGKPVNLGADGSAPTGTAAIVYQHLQKGQAVANFATNRGTGGNFTITGTLDTASTSPSD